VAQVKNYGLIGVGNNLQLGKNGPKLEGNADTGTFVLTNEGGSLTTISGANATQSSELVTKAQLDAVSADALVSDIEYNSGTVTMGTIADGTKTIQTVLSVDTAFDGNTVIQVGTDTNNSLLLSAPYYDLTSTEDYVTFSTVEFATTETIKAFITQGNSTVGNGSVIVSVLDGPVTGSGAGGGSGVALTDLSVTSSAPSGNGILSYNNTTGVFTFAPTDTNLFLTSVPSDVTLNTLTVNDGVKEKLQSKSITGSGTFTFQCANGQVFHVASPAANFGCNFTDLTIDTDYATATTIVVDQGATPYMPTSVAIAGSSATITWQGGSAPSGTANGVDVVTFSFLNVSGTVTVLGQSVSFS
jgi:hypothetical protein